MRIHLVNPSDVAFGVGVITPRWLYVLAAATPSRYGTPVIVDETLEPIRPERIQPGGCCQLERFRDTIISSAARFIGNGSGRGDCPPDCKGSRSQQPVIARSQ